MADFQFTEFPINATPLADVSEITSADGILVVKNGSVQKIPIASFLSAVGAFPQADISGYVPVDRTVNGNVLSANVSVSAAQVPFTPTSDIEATDVQSAITEAVGELKVVRDLLYQGSTSAIAVGGYTLNKDVSDYTYLEVWSGYNGRSAVSLVPVRDTTSFVIRIPNISDYTSTSTLLYMAETSAGFSGTTMNITNACSWQQGNGSTYSPKKDNNPLIYFEAVYGIKLALA